jgi:hypothetical protein
VDHLPIPLLWQTMVLQYISYEYRFGYTYANFLSTDMYEQLAPLRTDSPPREAAPAAAAFVRATTDFKTLYEELKCAPHATNPLFVAIA